ncbi:MAG: hypothetical protein AAGC53_13950 [Actinomycetota bacterium]
MVSHTGAAAVAPGAGDIAEVYVTGRDVHNRSLIGRVDIDLSAPEQAPVVASSPSLDLGGRGAFDDSGVAYPCLVESDGDLLLFYTGWRQTVTTPFENDLGRACLGRDGRFERVSRGPILPRTDADHLGIGSTWVRREADRWHMWYTSFFSWEAGLSGCEHSYGIKYAWSTDGLTWQRDDELCIGPSSNEDLSICRPTVWFDGSTYHMWFCHRGAAYRIGYASSTDGVMWDRDDAASGLELGAEGSWDDEAQCYPCVFERDGEVYLLYAGNDYGRGGLGLATLVRP